MNRTASATMFDGISMGISGWVVMITISDGIFSTFNKAAMMQFDKRKDAQKCYTLINSLIEGLK